MRAWKAMARRSPCVEAPRRWRPGRPDRTRRRAARRRGGRRSAGRTGVVRPADPPPAGGAAPRRRTACPRRRRRPVRAPRPPRCRSRPARRGRAARPATTRRSGRQLGASGAFATSNGGPPSAAVITRTSRSRIRSPPTTSRPLGLPAESGGPAAGEDAPRAPRVSSASLGSRSRITSMPIRTLKRCLYARSWGGSKPRCGIGPVTALDAHDVVPHFPPQVIAPAERQSSRPTPRAKRRAHPGPLLVLVDGEQHARRC